MCSIFIFCYFNKFIELKAPEPVESWAPITLDATNFGSTCMQTSIFAHSKLPQSEACLFLNVYVPGE